ncbi:MAG TPA: tetratricopeptide repeat protein [Nitrospinaceae bacterium]|nr:tetratricopeptide repeat protein [Nitrospinaceae bacterium]HIB43212.1 tetratricopeptide repeat protein [Nitrospina sp.]
MQKIIFFLVLVVFVFGMGCSGEKDASKVPDSKVSKDVLASLPEGPLNLPAESDPEANTHNEEGISHYKEGHFDIALKHFREAGKIQSEIGEIHFNEALALDKLGDHGDAAKHFKVAEENANGNTLILESKILLAHTR